VAKLQEFLAVSQFAVLTTVDEHGLLHTLPLKTPKQEFDGALWFVASSDEPFVERVNARRDVTVTYLDASSDRCLTLNGVARVARGGPVWATFARLFTNAVQGSSETVLIHVTVRSADLWE
jgi:general stress protein 26